MSVDGQVEYLKPEVLEVPEAAGLLDEPALLDVLDGLPRDVEVLGYAFFR